MSRFMGESLYGDRGFRGIARVIERAVATVATLARLSGISTEVSEYARRRPSSRRKFDFQY